MRASPFGETAEAHTRKITLNDLSSTDAPAEKGGTTTIVVTRATAKQNYTVPVEAKNEAFAGAQ